MNWFKHNKLYSIPDEIGSFADCSLNSSVIQCLNKQYNRDNLNTLTTLITTYTNELFDCINEFETNYRKFRHEFESKRRCRLFYDAYDKGDNDCLYEFLTPRAKHELSYIADDGEACENSCYYDIMYHIRYAQFGSKNYV